MKRRGDEKRDLSEVHSKTVYLRRKGISYGEGGFHVFTSGVSKPMPLDQYVCTTCGYFESYIADPAKLEAVAQAWEKVA